MAAQGQSAAGLVSPQPPVACRWPPSCCVLDWPLPGPSSPGSLCVEISSPHEHTHHTGLGPDGLILTQSHLSRPFSKNGRTLGSWGLELQPRNFGAGDNSGHERGLPLYTGGVPSLPVHGGGGRWSKPAGEGCECVGSDFGGHPSSPPPDFVFHPEQPVFSSDGGNFCGLLYNTR